MVHHTPLRRELRTVPSRQTLQKSAELQSHFPRGWSTCGIPCLSSESHVNMDEGLEWLEAGPLLLTLREPQLQRNACPASKKDSSSGTFKPRDERTPKKNPPRPGLASALTKPLATPMSVPQTTASQLQPRFTEEGRPRLRLRRLRGKRAPALSLASRARISAPLRSRTPEARPLSTRISSTCAWLLCPNKIRHSVTPSSAALVSTFPEGLVSWMPSTSASISI